jgi:hypothetical protein
VQWLLEFGGVDMSEANNDGQMVWNLLKGHFVKRTRKHATVTAILRVMELQGAPPAALIAAMEPDY